MSNKNKVWTKVRACTIVFCLQNILELFISSHFRIRICQKYIPNGLYSSLYTVCTHLKNNETQDIWTLKKCFGNDIFWFVPQHGFLVLKLSTNATRTCYSLDSLLALLVTQSHKRQVACLVRQWECRGVWSKSGEVLSLPWAAHDWLLLFMGWGRGKTVYLKTTLKKPETHGDVCKYSLEFFFFFFLVERVFLICS